MSETVGYTLAFGLLRETGEDKYEMEEVIQFSEIAGRKTFSSSEEAIAKWEHYMGSAGDAVTEIPWCRRMLGLVYSICPQDGRESTLYKVGVFHGESIH